MLKYICVKIKINKHLYKLFKYLINKVLYYKKRIKNNFHFQKNVSHLQLPFQEVDSLF